MREIVVATDDFKPVRDAANVRLDIAGDLYEVKRPKNTVGAMFQRLKARAEAGDMDAMEEMVTKTLRSFLVHEEDIEYFTERAVDMDDWIEIDFIMHCMNKVALAFQELPKEGEKPSQAARRRSAPADRKPAAKKTASKRAPKPAKPAQS